MKITITASALMLCLVSLACSILLWVSIPTDLFGKALAGITATALEVCKFAFFPAGLFIFTRNRLGGIALWILGSLLLGISVAATIGFLENAHNQQSQSQQQQSIAWQTKQQQLESLETQINNLNQMIAVDSANGYRQRGYDNAHQVEKLEQVRSQLLADVRNLENSASGSAGSLFSVMGMALRVSSVEARQLAFTGLAIILDVCAVAALLTLAALRLENPPQNTRTATETPAKASTPKKPAANNVFTQQQLSPNEQALARRILAGEFGQPPSVRQIVTQAKGGHATVKKIMEHLLQTDQVRREGKRYYLVQNIIN